MSRVSFASGRLVARLAAPVLLALGLGACSSIPDWVDPGNWFGGNNQTAADQNGTPADASQAQDSGTTPDLASIPPKPTPPSTPDEQKQVANSLVADRAQAQYSSEALEGGTEPVAAPPPPAQSSAAPENATSPAAPADQSASAPSAAPPTAASNGASDAPASGAASASPATTADNASQPPAGSPGTEVASTESPSTAAPAAAPIAAATTGAPPAAAGAQASFAPSQAPALDPSVAKYVPQRILSRYEQTAAAAAVPGVEGMSAAAAKPAHRRKARTGQPAPAVDTLTAPSP